MPSLEHLELTNMFLGPELASFFVDRAERPLSLSLTNVKPDANYGRGYTWKQFFDRLVESRVFFWRLDWARRQCPSASPGACGDRSRKPKRS